MAVQAETLRELTARKLQFINAALARKAAKEYSEGNPDIADASLQLGVDIATTRQRFRVELTEIAVWLRSLGLDNLEGETISPPVVPAKENLSDQVWAFRSTERPQSTAPENPYGKLWTGLRRKPVKIYTTGMALFSLNENGAFLHDSKNSVGDAANLGNRLNFDAIRVDLRNRMLKIGEEECLTIFPNLNKCLEIARREVPNRPFAECLKYLMYDRFYRVEKHIKSATEPNKRYGQRQETLVRELFALNEEQTGLRHQDFNQVVEVAYADLLKDTDGQRRNKQIKINQSSGYQSRNLIRSRFAVQGEEWVVVKYPDVKTFLVWARQQPQFAKKWSFLDLVDYGLRLKKIERAITPVQPEFEAPIIAPSPNGAVAEPELTIYSAPKVQFERVDGKEAPITLKLSPGERLWLVKAACELPPADYRFSGIPDSNIPTNT